MRRQQGSLLQRNPLPGMCRALHGPACPSSSPATLPTVHGEFATSQTCASHRGSMASTAQRLLLPMPGTLLPSLQTSSGAVCPTDPTGNSPACLGWQQQGCGARPVQGRGAHSAGQEPGPAPGAHLATSTAGSIAAAGLHPSVLLSLCPSRWDGETPG